MHWRQRAVEAVVCSILNLVFTRRLRRILNSPRQNRPLKKKKKKIRRRSWNKDFFLYPWRISCFNTVLYEPLKKQPSPLHRRGFPRLRLSTIFYLFFILSSKFDYGEYLFWTMFILYFLQVQNIYII